MTAAETILSGYSKAIIKKAAQIRVLAFDVDGVLTDGKIIYSATGDELKTFNVRDGLIISHLKKAGFITGIISGRESAAVTRRAVELKLDFCHQGIEDKAWAFSQILKHHKLKAKDVCFVGDDINDLPVFDLAGLRICPADAPGYLHGLVDLTTTSKGGKGVIREVAELLLASRGSFDKILKSVRK